MTNSERLKILKQAGEINHNAEKYRNEVSNIINKLNLFVDKKIDLTDDEIKKFIDQFFYHTSLISFPIKKGHVITRAANCNLESQCHTEVSRLSYIPKGKEYLSSLGRMNKNNEIMFYGSLHSHNNAIGTVLSEVHAEKGDCYNLLISNVIKDINVVYIGLLDYARREIAPPIDSFDKTYIEIYALYKETVSQDGMIALELCDAFLTDILKRTYPNEEIYTENTKRLYKVTSEIAKECLRITKADGIIYPSVKLEGFPNVVLKPQVVEINLKYDIAASINVIDKFGYGIYKTEYLHLGFIDNKSDKIDWTPISSIPGKIAYNAIIV